MTVPSYDVVTVDLTVAHTQARFAENQPIESITVQQLDSAATMRLGPGAPDFPLVFGQTIDICPAATEGIFITNAAAAGLLILLVNFGGAKAQSL